MEVIPKKTSAEKAIIVIYFAFTTLSTVGFGDYFPYSEVERLVGAFLLLFGVAIFSLFMGVFIEIIDKYREVNADLEEGDKLARFFGVIKHFNGDIEIKLELKREIEDYFTYRWQNNRNQATTSISERAILDQLPDEVQDKLFSHFLFFSFTTTFAEMFRIPKYGTVTQSIRNSVQIPVSAKYFYNWEDQNFREFMMKILSNLEPRFIPRDKIIFTELEEIHEVLFVSQGQVDVGFEINRK